MEDRYIVALFLRRAETAIAAVAKKYGIRLTALAQNILADRRDAEEAVSDTYLALWNTIPPQEPDPLSAYSFRICRNISLNKYRANTAQMRNAAYIEIPGAGAAPPPEEIIDFILDRPFLFLITEGSGVPLFAGTVNQP